VAVLWGVDRGADALVALDGRLGRVGLVECPDPARAVRAADGGLWVLRAVHPHGPARLARIGPAGEHTEVALGPVRALAAAGRHVLVLEAARERECLLWVFATVRERRLLGAFPGGTCLAGRAGQVLVGRTDGTLLALGVDGVQRARGDAGVRPAALEPAGDGGGWWVLGDGRIVRLDAGLGVLWTRPVEQGLTDLAPLPGGGAWVGGDGRATRFGAAGEQEAVVTLPPGPWQAESARAGRLWLRATGAVVEVCWHGTWARAWRSEGGFDALVDLALVDGDARLPANGARAVVRGAGAP